MAFLTLWRLLMKNNVVFKCHIKDENYILNKMLKNGIDIVSSKTTNRYIYYTVSENHFENLIKTDYKKVVIFEKYDGPKYYHILFFVNLEKIIVSLSIIILLFLSKLYILKVNIYTSDTYLKKLIKYSLMDEGIKNNSIRKSYNQTKIIKDKLINKYKDEIEWLEIEKKGYEYDVRLIKREKNEKGISGQRCNYVAIKSGTIKSIIAKKGVLMVQENNFVNSGEILISGDIIYNEELKTSVCADGKITGEVWYKVNVSYPLKKTKYYLKNNGTYNISMNIFNKKYKIFNDKYNESKKIASFGNDDFGLTVTKSSKKFKKTIAYSEEEASKKALDLVKKKIKLKAAKNSRILSENILKKDINNGKIDMEVLITVEEELGVVENY